MSASERYRPYRYKFLGRGLMLGIIITGIIEMIEEHDGLSMIDALMHDEESAFTAYEQYDDSRFYALLNDYAKLTSIPESLSYQRAGKFLFPYLMNLHPQIDAQKYSFEDILKYLDSDIHPAVANIYSESRLPKVTVVNSDKNSMTIEHHTHRQTHELLKGLIMGMAEYYERVVELETLQEMHPLKLRISWNASENKHG